MTAPSSISSDIESLSLISNDIRIVSELKSFKNHNNMNAQEDQTAEQRIYPDEFFVWNNPSTPPSPTFDEKAPPPYIVLMECQINSLNIGKFNPIAIADLVQTIIGGKRLIQRSSINRVKITCESNEVANRLIDSPILISKFYKVYIRNSLKFTRSVIKDYDCSISVGDFVSRLSPEVVQGIASIRRRVTINKQMLESMEIKFFGTNSPTNILVSSFKFSLTHISMKPIRCLLPTLSACRVQMQV